MDIFKYEDYRLFLRDSLALFPKKGHGQVLKIAQYLQVHPTLVSQVLNGDRDFSTEQTLRLCSYLGLPTLESDFLILMVQHERAGTTDLKKYYLNKLAELKKSSLKIVNRLQDHRVLTEQEKSIFYSSWLYMAVWLYTSIADGVSVDDIANRFILPRAKIMEVLTFLKNAQLCAENEGRYQMLSQQLHLEYGSVYLARHHSQWRIKSLQRMEDITEQELMFTSPISISRKDFMKIREELVRLIKSTSQIIKDSPAEDVACLNLELLWVQK